MIYIYYVLMSSINIILRILGYIVVPIGVLCTKKNEQFMPLIFNWWNHQLGFITNPISYLPKAAPYNGQLYTSYDELFDKDLKDKGQSITGRIARIRWLYRNPCDMFNHLYTDITVKDDILVQVRTDDGKYYSGSSLYSNLKIGNRANDVSGLAKAKSARYFEWYFIKPYKVFGYNLCWRLRFGWKLYDKRVGDRAEFDCNMSCFAPYRGL
jgi:hypothetical protein